MTLLLLGVDFAGKRQVWATAGEADAAAPAVGPVLRGQRERIAAFEMSRGLAQRSAEDLPPAPFKLHPHPIGVGILAEQIVTDGDVAFRRRLVARPTIDDQVERRTAAMLAVALLLQPVIFHEGIWTDRQASAPELVGQPARGGIEPAIPLAVGLAGDGLATNGTVEHPRAVEVDRPRRPSREGMEVPERAPPVEAALELAAEQLIVVLAILARKIGEGQADAAGAAERMLDTQ